MSDSRFRETLVWLGILSEPGSAPRQRSARTHRMLAVSAALLSVGLFVLSIPEFAPRPVGLAVVGFVMSIMEFALAAHLSRGERRGGH